ERDLGRFRLELSPFDWSAKTLTATQVSAAELPELSWELHYPDEKDADSPGAVYADEHVEHGEITRGGVYAEHVEARGGRAFLVVNGRQRAGEKPCGASVVPLIALPGYRERDAERAMNIRVPTCQATLEDTIEIPAGPFIFGGPGQPPSELAKKYRGPEQV